MEANIGAVRIRIGFWGPLSYIYDKEALPVLESQFRVPKDV